MSLRCEGVHFLVQSGFENSTVPVDFKCHAALYRSMYFSTGALIYEHENTKREQT